MSRHRSIFVDLIGLKHWVRGLKYDEIEVHHHRPLDVTPKLLLSMTRTELEFYKKHQNVFDLSKMAHVPIIEPDEPFLVDKPGNTLSVFVKVIGKKRAKKHRLRFIGTVVSNCTKQFGTPVNGVFKIPNRFLL